MIESLEQRWRRRARRCAELGHPGATYSPWSNRTWCLCGAESVPGDHADHVTCCGGPLDPRPTLTA